jgi:hypothetical protein
MHWNDTGEETRETRNLCHAEAEIGQTVCMDLGHCSFIQFSEGKLWRGLRVVYLQRWKRRWAMELFWWEVREIDGTLF